MPTILSEKCSSVPHSFSGGHKLFFFLRVICTNSKRRHSGEASTSLRFISRMYHDISLKFCVGFTGKVVKLIYSWLKLVRFNFGRFLRNNKYPQNFA